MNKRQPLLLSLLLSISITACGGGGSDSSTAPNLPPPSEPTAPPLQKETSYENFKAIGLTPQWFPSEIRTDSIRAYGDFSGNGRIDLFTATITYMPTTNLEAATPSKFEFWLRQTDGSYRRDTQLLASSDGCIHPRKALVADFNSDTRPDIFVACHGWDAPPFPGERNKVVLSQPNGTYAVMDASSDVGFFHGASAADLDNDGWIDVMVVDNFDPNRVFVLLNQHNGLFAREPKQRLPTVIQSGSYFSVELVDVDEDGRLDVVLGGHEWEGTPTRILINASNDHDFTNVTPLTIPPIANEGVVLDFTLTGSDASRTLWVLRTSGGDGTFYQSRTLQRVSWPSLQSTVVLNERPKQWVMWTIPTHVDGKPVIASDDARDALIVPQ